MAKDHHERRRPAIVALTFTPSRPAQTWRAIAVDRAFASGKGEPHATLAS